MTKIVRSLRLLLGVCVGMLALGMHAPVDAQSCQFILGFATLQGLIPNVVGQCIGNETYDLYGNAYQQTDKGMLLWRKAENWTAFTDGHMTWVNGPQGVQARLNTQRFAWETGMDDLPLADTGLGQTAQTYLDDRSSADALMLSFINALNRHEYLRAYSYWEPDASQLPSFSNYEQGYAHTQSVRLIEGTVTEGAGAGNLYAAVPTTLIAQTTNGTTQTFVGCYLLHLGQPAIQGVPPFQPWAIQSADVSQVPNNANTATLMAQVCAAQAGQPLSPQPAFNPTDVSANRYLDDRSDASELMRSFVNALNRHEYVRAYSYWLPDAAQLPSFQQFQQGYADTQSVQLAIGSVSSDAGAGQLYYSVPITLIAQTTGGNQYFTGCYVLHLSQPAVQGTPPFQPLAIQSANVKQVASQPKVSQASQYCQ